MKKWLREHGLLLANGSLFVAFLIGMTITGWHVANNESVRHGEAPQSLPSYLVSGDFYEAVFENWESEFLQMGSYVVLTVFLFQKGSLGVEAPRQARPAGRGPAQTRERSQRARGPFAAAGFALLVYENSLLLLFVILFIGSFVGHAISGAAAYSEELTQHGARSGHARSQYLGTGSSGSSPSRTGRASSWWSPLLIGPPSTFANAARASPSRYTLLTRKPGTSARSPSVGQLGRILALNQTGCCPVSITEQRM